MKTYDSIDVEPKKLPVEFVAPHPLEKAVGILRNQHQEGTWWAWKGQRRTVVSIRQLDPYLYEFRVRKVPKSKLSGTYSNIVIKGYLKRLDDYSTLVVGESQIPLIAMLMLSVALLSLFVFIAIMIVLEPEGDSSSQAMPIVIAVLLGPILIGSLFWEKWQLTTMLKNILGGY